MQASKLAALAMVVALSARGAVPWTSAGCPVGASAKAMFEIVDEQGRPMRDVSLILTASNWDSTLGMVSDSGGRVEILCLPAGDGYDVTVLNPGGGITHVSADASEEPRLLRIVVGHPAEGRYIRVTHRGSAIPGLSVKITDGGRPPQTVTTDQDGVARYPELTGSGEAVVDIFLAGFRREHARIDREHKNGPMLFDLTLLPVCEPMRVVH
jgi:hypothetical protein